MNGRFLEIVRSTSGSRVVQGQDGLGRVWESEFWAENKGGSLIRRIREREAPLFLRIREAPLFSVFRVSYVHILKS